MLAAKSQSDTSDPADLSKIDELYRELATARAGAALTNFYRTKWESTKKDLRGMTERAELVEKRLSEITSKFQNFSS